MQCELGDFQGAEPLEACREEVGAKIYARTKLRSNFVVEINDMEVVYLILTYVFPVPPSSGRAKWNSATPG